MSSKVNLQVFNIGGGKVPEPLAAWPPAYTYTNETCGAYGCRKCWQCVSANPNYITPSMMDRMRSTDSIWITTSFFRFEEEAWRYLTLPSYNKARRGMYLDLPSTRLPDVRWRPCAGSLLGNQPGGALEHQLIVLDSSQGWTPVLINEVFQTIPQGSTQQPTPNPGSWGFYFNQLR